MAWGASDTPHLLLSQTELFHAFCFLEALTMMIRCCTWTLLGLIALSAAEVRAEEESSSDAMVAHNVFFTLREASREKADEMVAAMEKYLAKHPGEVYFAAAHRWQEGQRPVHDRDWDIALHSVFRNAASLEQYEKSDRHQQFIAEYKAHFSNVRVFDSVVAASSHSEQLPPGTGVFVWHEVMTRDVKKTRDFYHKVFGWDAEPINMENVGDYLILKKDGKELGGLQPMNTPQFEGVPPNWLTYVATDDIEATVKKVKAAGGKVKTPIVPLPFGKFAVLADPTGAVFAVFEMGKQ
jgi:predicted enzyme related to lactoylglutathione lyase